MGDELAAVGERPVGRRQVDRPNLLDAEARAPARPIGVSVWNVIPKSFARAKRCSGVLTTVALTEGMFSENWSAFRTRTGPRSRLSASDGV